MHLATARDLILADHRNVVLSLAGDRAGITTDTRAKIDNHAPRVTAMFVFVRLIQCFIPGRFFLRFCDLFWLGKKFGQRPAAQEIAPFHLMMLLRRGERMFLARLANRQAVAEPKRIGSA